MIIIIFFLILILIIIDILGKGGKSNRGEKWVYVD